MSEYTAEGKVSQDGSLDETYHRYLAEHAIPIEIARRAGVGSATREDISRLLDKPLESIPSAGIVFPYPDVSPSYCRVRFDNPGEDHPRYLVPYGREVPAYFVTEVNYSEGDLVVVESPPKALALVAIGYRCIGLGGVATTLTKEGKKLNSSWKRLDLRDRTVTILFDSDIKTNCMVAAAAPRLALALGKCGAVVKIAELPQNDLGEDCGPDDYIAKNGPDAFKSIIDNARPEDPIAALSSLTQSAALDLLSTPLFALSIGSREPLVKVKVKRMMANLGVKASELNDYLRFVTQELKTKQSTRAISREVEQKAIPDILISSQPLAVINEAWNAILTSSKRNIFRFGSTIGLVEETDGKKSLRVMTRDKVHGELMRRALWSKRNKGNYEDATPPDYLARDILCNPHSALKSIEGIVSCPVLGKSNRLVMTPGFNEGENLWLDVPPDADLSSFDAQATRLTAQRASEFLQCELLVDFPYDCDASRANSLSAMILPFVRPAIAEPTPLHIFDAPKAGSGKSLFVETITMIPSGRAAGIMTEGRDDDEWRKRITATVREAPQFVLIDNIRRTLDSSPLAAALTALTWDDRILGESTMVHLPQRAIWFCTGNNIQTSDEIARRSLVVRFVPSEERPHERSGFRHPDLRAYVKSARWQIVCAILNIVQAWLNEGMPRGNKTLGSFEEWARMMGGILEVAGVTGFLGNMRDFYEDNDREGSDWREFVRVWYEKYGATPVETSKLLELAKGGNLLLDLFGRKTEASELSRLGRALSKRRDQIMAGYRIVLSKGLKGHSRYHLEQKAGGTVTVDPAEVGTNLGLAKPQPINGCEHDSRGAGTNTNAKCEISPCSSSMCINGASNLPEAHDSVNPGIPAPCSKEVAPEPAGSAEVFAEVVADFSTPAYTLITDVESLPEIAHQIDACRFIAIDMETTGLDPILDRPRLLQIGLPNGTVYIVDLFATGGAGVLGSAIRSSMIIVHNAAFDLSFLKHSLGLEPASVWDTMLASQVLGCGLDLRTAGVHSLGGCVQRFLSLRLPKGEQLSSWAGELTSVQLQYAARDVSCLLPLQKEMAKCLEQEGLSATAKLEFDLVPVVVEMRLTGLPLALGDWTSLVNGISQETRILEVGLKKELDIENVNSPKQLLAALKSRGFVLEKTNSGQLAQYSHDPVVQKINDYRMGSSFVNNFGANIAGAAVKYPDGRIRGQIAQLGTETGRFICKAPNLLGLPKGSRAIRGCFKPISSRVLIVADYAALQLRIIAQVTGDEALADTFRAGGDPHRHTAALILGKDPLLVTKEERQHAKAVNFGFVFGMGARKFVAYAEENYNVALSLEEAEQYRRRFFDAYPGIHRWHRSVGISKPAATHSLGGRTRKFIDPSHRYCEQLSSPIQGTEVDGIKNALIRCHRALKQYDAKILLCVHDEIIVEAAIEQASVVKTIVEQCMIEGMAQYVEDVPIEVKVEIRKSWAE